VLKWNLGTIARLQFENLSCSLPGINDETKTDRNKRSECNCRDLNQDTPYNKSEASPLSNTDLESDSLRFRIRTSFVIECFEKRLRGLIR